MKSRKIKKIKMILVITLFSGYFLLEILMGFETNSVALISDAYTMLSDLISVVIGLVCLILSTKTWNKSTFGWARIEVMGALINSIFLIAISFSIFTNSIERIVNPEDIKYPWFLLGIGIGGLVLNALGIFLFLGDAKNNDEGEKEDDDDDSVFYENPNDYNDPYQERNIKTISPKKEDVIVTIESTENIPTRQSGGSMNIQAVILHLLGDFLGSVVVVISALVTLFANFNGVNRIDPILSIFMVIVMIISTVPIFKQSARVLLQSLPSKMKVPKLISDLQSQVTDLRGLHDLHVWQLVGSKLIASVHLNCTDIADYERLSIQLRSFFHKKGIFSTTIQPEFTELKHSTKRKASFENICSLDFRASSTHLSASNSQHVPTKTLNRYHSNPAITPSYITSDFVDSKAINFIVETSL